MDVHGSEHATLPGTMLHAERDFYLELRRVIGVADLSLRALEETTFSPKSPAGDRSFYSKSQWSRWINGQSRPPRKAVATLAAALTRDGIDASHLVRLWDEAFAVAGPDRPGDREAGLPRQLPAGIAHFTGRHAELEVLDRALDDAESAAAGTVVISAIGGMAGVGKTALALRWAHQVAERFPDGQLYVNLRGFDPGGVAVTPAEAIRGFLDALGVPPGQIPQTPDGQAGLYRRLLAGKKMLIMLDNARDEQQVRPLLPASPGSLVLVTSRSQLVGLAVADGAQLLNIDVLPETEARQLLATRISSARADAEPDAIAQIAQLCGCLPLALAVAAARGAGRPRLPLAALANELHDTTGRLDALDAGDAAASVRAVFSWSYRQLSPEAARMFRLLGIHRGPDITEAAAASLAGCDRAQARQALGELARAHLIAEQAAGRYSLHNLLRAHAAAEGRATDSEPDRRMAAGRVLDHYLHTAHSAATLITPSRDPITLAPAQPGVTPELLASPQQAVSWFDAEYQVLLAAIELARRTGSDVHAWQIPWTMADFLYRRGHWHEWAAIQRTALSAATRLGDIAGQAASLRYLANACSELGDHDEALSHYAAALTLYQQAGDRLGEAQVHQLLAVAADAHSRYADALSHSEQALRLYQAIGHRPGEARTLNNMGRAYARLGDYQQARMFCQQSLALTTELGHRYEEAGAWDTLGYAEQHLGNFAEAAACYQRALSLFREFGDLPTEAEALAHLGDTLQAAGEHVQARDAWEQALGILDELQHPSAGQVRARLAGAREPAVTQAPASSTPPEDKP